MNIDLLVGKKDSIGANCTIVCGVRIRHHTFVGARSMVSEDIRIVQRYQPK